MPPVTVITAYDLKFCAHLPKLFPRNLGTARLSAPGFMSALGYLDGYRSAWLPANLIQAQRDYFGAHTYERVDAKGTFHTEWGRSEAGRIK